MTWMFFFADRGTVRFREGGVAEPHRDHATDACHDQCDQGEHDL